MEVKFPFTATRLTIEINNQRKNRHLSFDLFSKAQSDRYNLYQ
ncbi:hypothetical protein [Nostoc sp.]